MRSAWSVGVAVTSLLVIASTSFAQSFCSDLDRVVKLAPSGFRSIRDDANSGALETTVTQSLPGASWCWYENAAGTYWCSWDVPSEQVGSQVKQLAIAIGGCYQVQAKYDASMQFAFVDLPDSISVYINGVAEMVTLSIGRNLTERDSSGNHSPAGPALAPANLATPSLLTPLHTGQPMPEERISSPEAGQDVGGVRTPRDGPPVGPSRARH
jgi:hypothetical protein